MLIFHFLKWRSYERQVLFCGTVEYILNKYMEDLELYFIVGQDAFQAVTTWKDWERLLLLCNFAVMTVRL